MGVWNRDVEWLKRVCVPDPNIREKVKVEAVICCMAYFIGVHHRELSV